LAFAQEGTIDTITVYYKYYSTTFSKPGRFPVVVKYWTTKYTLDCVHRIKRSKRFIPDPLLPEFTNLDKDYKKSGYDRGHQMDAYDCGCDSTAKIVSFNYSNIAPQLPSLIQSLESERDQYLRALAQTGLILIAKLQDELLKIIINFLKIESLIGVG
jgi:DNA/RNA endonuclease G (NUC1)